MSHFHRITVKISFGVMADSEEEAEELAKDLCPVDDAPTRADITVEAYRTPNQTDRIKREAINYEQG